MFVHGKVHVVGLMMTRGKQGPRSAGRKSDDFFKKSVTVCSSTDCE